MNPAAQERSPGPSVIDLAERHGLGTWVSTERVNETQEPGNGRRGLVNTIVGVVLLALYFLLDLPGYGKVLLLVFGLGLLVLNGPVMLLASRGLAKLGVWLTHTFEGGLVMERTGSGDLRAARFDELDAELMFFDNSAPSTAWSADSTCCSVWSFPTAPTT